MVFAYLIALKGLNTININSHRPNIKLKRHLKANSRSTYIICTSIYKAMGCKG